MAFAIDNTEFDLACADIQTAQGANDADEEVGQLVLLSTLCRAVAQNQKNNAAMDRYFDFVGEKTAFLMRQIASMAAGVYVELRTYAGGNDNDTILPAEVLQGPIQ